MVERTPPDNPITETIKKAVKPNLKGIDGGKSTTPEGDAATAHIPKIDIPLSDYDWISPCLKYGIYRNEFYYRKDIKGGVHNDRLSNFCCEYTLEINYSDGLKEESYFLISGVLQDGTLLPEIKVLYSKFKSMSWPLDSWGGNVIIESGSSKEPNLRTAIQKYSTRNGKVSRRTIYGHTGWARINDQWQFLTSSGAIGENGLDTGVTVDLGDGNLSKICLPEAPAKEQLRQEISAVFDLLKIAPTKPEIGAMIFAAAVLAPLNECKQTDYVIFWHGQTGGFKSCAAALAMSFFGEFEHDTPTSTFLDTPLSVDTRSFKAKDVCFLQDDLKPASSSKKTEQIVADAEDRVRGIGNGSYRARGNTDSTMQRQLKNRSFFMMTAEILLNYQSIFGRALVVEICKGDIPHENLGKIQALARNGAFRRIMSAYIQWLASRLDTLKTDLPRTLVELRDIAIRQNRIISAHPRTIPNYADLVAGIDVFFQYLYDQNLVDLQTKECMFDEIDQALMGLSNAQAVFQDEQDEVERFAKLLRAALRGGNGHICQPHNQAPPIQNPYAYGWRKGNDGDHPMGDCFGWFHLNKGKPEIWLDKEKSFEVATKLDRSFMMPKDTLFRRMADHKYFVHSEYDTKRNRYRYDVSRKIAGKSDRVYIVPESWLFPDSEHEQRSGDEEKN